MIKGITPSVLKENGGKILGLLFQEAGFVLSCDTAQEGNSPGVSRFTAHTLDPALEKEVESIGP